MEESITLNDRKARQCRQNASAKSERKRQAVFEAIQTLQKQGVPVTKSAVVRHANVSHPFLSKHADLLQAIDTAAKEGTGKLVDSPGSRSRDVAIAAMQRQMEKLKQQVKEKDTELRRKQKEINQLYGKLASDSSLTDVELRHKLTEVLNQLQAFEDKE